jgi:predicted fused transcriptional regulator/phosphomethylpyrimidine kinase
MRGPVLIFKSSAVDISYSTATLLLLKLFNAHQSTGRSTANIRYSAGTASTAQCKRSAGAMGTSRDARLGL